MLETLVEFIQNHVYVGVVLIVLVVPVMLYLLFSTRIFKRVFIRESFKTTDLDVLKRVPEIIIPFEKLSLIWTLELEQDVEEKAHELRTQTEQEVQLLSLAEKEEIIVQGDKEIVLPLLQHESLKKLWNTVVTPYLDEFKLQNVLPLVIEGFVLLDKHFTTSSLSGFEEDPETVQITSYKDIISSVSLGEHTVNVVDKIVNEAKKMYYSPEAHIPRLVIAALFHDIGKVKEYQEKYAGSRSHPFVSANLFLTVAKSLYKDNFPVVWVEDIAQAIREHHVPTKHELACALKRADTKSRALEVALRLGNLELRDIELWFDVDEFKKDLFNLLNVDQVQPAVGFTFENCIYVRKQGLIYLVDIQRRRKNVLSHEFLYHEGVEDIKNRVTKILISKGLTVSDRGWHKKVIHYRGRSPYEVYLLVLKGSIFTPEEMRELEIRRQGSLYAGIVQIQ